MLLSDVLGITQYDHLMNTGSIRSQIVITNNRFANVLHYTPYTSSY